VVICKRPRRCASSYAVIPLSERLLGPRDVFSTRILGEHQTFRRLVEHITTTRADPPNCVPSLQQFGELLETHIRFEEREWFEALQDVLDAETFTTIDAALTARLPSARGGTLA
jgi:hypothetical protein